MSEALKFTKVQELIYELPIERVMRKGVITVSPETSMMELKEILRVNRISGVAVLDKGHLAGVISIEDLIKALEKGEIEAPVAEKMTRRPITVRDKDSVVEAVKKFAQYRVGRLLVVNGQGDLVGILTGGDITRGLLEAISLDYHVEEISRYRARHIFEDIVSDKTSLILRYKAKPKDFSGGGRASSKLKRALDRLGAHPEDIRRVAISAYEAEMNLVIHADEGGQNGGRDRTRKGSPLDHRSRSWDSRYRKSDEARVFNGSQLDSGARFRRRHGAFKHQAVFRLDGVGIEPWRRDPAGDRR